jgi:signal transduction histidine kinase
MWKKILILFIVFGFSLMIIVGLSLYSFQRFNAYIQYADAVDHNHNFLSKLYKLKNKLLETESNQRSFLEFQDSSYFYAYASQVDEIKKTFSILSKEIQDNPDQEKKLHKLNITIKSRIDYLRSGLMLGYPPTNYEEEKKIMQQCTAIMDEMESEEIAMLRKRYNTKEFYEDSTPRNFRTVFVFTMVVFVISFGLLLQQFISRINYQKKLEKKILELHQANEEWEQLSYVASHDLQEPLRKIRTFSDRLQSKFGEQLTDEGKIVIARIEAASARAQFLLQDIVNYNMIVFTHEDEETVDLQAIISNICIEKEIMLKEKNAIVECTELPRLKAYPTQVSLLFQCLIENSLKFAKPGEACRIQIKSAIVKKNNLPKGAQLPDNQYIKIEVSDNGIGFENQFVDKIFKMFQRLHPQESSYEGRGLGLAIAKRIMTNHDGVVIADGTPGKGATFILYFPVS